MDFNQSDRDALRASQHRIQSQHLIGNIIEHRTQNPKRYLESSRNAVTKTRTNSTNLDKQSPTLEPHAKSVDIILDESQELKLNYRSEYLNNEPKKPLKPLLEDRRNELPENLEELQANSWLNMDHVEYEKLIWMSDKADRIYNERLKTSTHFDKDGRAVAGNVVTKERHSSDNNQLEFDQTYDLESLVMLLDSTYDPKVTYAMNVITKIAGLTTTGYYDGVFTENIYDTLLNKCLLRVRHHLDSSNQTSFLSALRCLRALLYNTQVDEVILDRIYPITSDKIDPNLWLQTFEMESREITIEMKDVECVEVDAVLALICRTDLLVKFNYLLKNRYELLNHSCHDYMLDILIRMARHSPLVCYLISKRTLLTSMIELFLGTPDCLVTDVARRLCVKTLKLIRIIAQACYELQEDKESKIHNRINTQVFSLAIKSIEGFLAMNFSDQSSRRDDQLLNIHIEAIRLTKTLARIKVLRQDIISTVSLLQAQMYIDCKALTTLDATKSIEPKISFNWQKAAHLIDLIGYLSHQEKDQVEYSVEILWSTYAKPALFKWLKAVIESNQVPHIDVSIAIATGMNHINRRSDEKSRFELQDFIIDLIHKSVQTGSKLHYFKLLSKIALENSQVNEFLKNSGRSRDPKGLPSFGCLQFNLTTKHNFDLHPVVDTYSPFVLLDAFIRAIPLSRPGHQDKIGILINNVHLSRYMRLISSYQNYPESYESSIQQSFLDQHEIRIACRALILLGNHYLYHGLDGETTIKAKEIPMIEPTSLTKVRIESYGNLFYYTIKILGLLNPIAKHIVEIKDQLFDKLLLNLNIHARLMREIHAKKPNVSDLRFHNVDFLTGDSLFYELDNNQLEVLLPLYMCCEHPNRFWMFQPIIDYYTYRLKDPDPARDENPEFKDKWFRVNMPWRLHTGQLASANDSVIFNCILTFNHLMMQCSACYLDLVIKPNLENYICLIGSTFLDDNIFLDDSVSSSISNNMKTILSRCTDASGSTKALFQDASITIGALDLTLADFFNKLVDQFEAASYGNAAFSNFLLLFITPKSDKVFRRKLFQEKAETCLRQMRIGIDELWSPVKLFVQHKESDPEIKGLIARSKHYIPRGSFLAHYYEFHTS